MCDPCELMLIVPQMLGTSSTVSPLVIQGNMTVHEESSVVEPFNDDGTWRASVFYNTIGTSYIEIALRAARAADPAAKLYVSPRNSETFFI